MTQKATDITKEEQNLDKRQYLRLTRDQWLWPLAALLCLSMIGLEFPLGYIGLMLVLINRWKNDRYDFLIIATICFGGFAFTDNSSFPWFKTYDVGLVVCFGAIIFLRKEWIVKKTLIAVIAFYCALLVFAMLSEERLSIQFRMMRNYSYILYFMLPFLIFANRPFDIKTFFKHLLPYVIIICIFYAIDGFILSGNVLIPNSHIWGSIKSRFYAMYWHPFSFDFHRKYPPGLFWMALCVFPITRYYKLTRWQWLCVILAFAASRTFTVISGLLVAYVLFQPQLKKIAWYLVGAIALLGILYMVDTAMNVSGDDESPLRISSSINQFTNLSKAQDQEDYAEFASGRMAQIIPKTELVFSLHREWIGLGFLHPQLTTNPKYIIFNDLYSDIQAAEELSTGVEVETAQVFLNIGFIGLIVYALYYLYLCYLVRRYKYARFFYSTMVAIAWFGFGGFAGLSAPMGLILVGLAYGIVIIAQPSSNVTNNT